MMNFRKKLLTGIGVLALSAAPALAGSALAQGGVGTTTGTSAAAGTTSEAGTGNLGTQGVDTTGTGGSAMDSRNIGNPATNAGATGGLTTGSISASASEDVEDRGYRNIEPARRANVPDDQLAFNAVDPIGNPVLLIVDRSTGRVVREKEMRTLPTPSKNQ